MVSQVGLNTLSNNPYLNNTGYNTNIGNNYSYNLPFSGITNTTSNNNLLNFSPVANSYNNDIMMSNFDNMLTASMNQQQQTQNLQNIQTPNPYQQSVFTGAQQQVPAEETQTATQQQMNMDELEGCLAARDKNLAFTENNNPYVKTDIGKKAGTILGFLAPVAGKVVQLFNGAKFKDLFKFKQLAIACPAVALAGLGIGYLIDNCVNSKKAQAADNAALAKQQNVFQPKQSMIA